MAPDAQRTHTVPQGWRRCGPAPSTALGTRTLARLYCTSQNSALSPRLIYSRHASIWPSPAALLPLPLADREPESRNVPVSPLRWYLSASLAGGPVRSTWVPFCSMPRPQHCQDSYTFAAFGTSPGHPKVKGGRLLLIDVV